MSVKKSERKSERKIERKNVARAAGTGKAAQQDAITSATETVRRTATATATATAREAETQSAVEMLSAAETLSAPETPSGPETLSVQETAHETEAHNTIRAGGKTEPAAVLVGRPVGAGTRVGRLTLAVVMNAGRTRESRGGEETV